MRGKVSNMVAVHGAALVAPYGVMSVGVDVVCPLLPLREKGRG
ncbi:hypothetical protein KBAD11_21730 [Aeromonas dhakensis]|nr:hypothetical protein KBAD59_21300 [Aeromonas dhakensis]CAD7508777.1 hypothetical protein KBAD11_21730 [Aeromonas dhakensis]CAD7521021.1 hypothetical protein KBAD50_20630 [Aeromonas dhakensis]CAD7522603.1 hypothetical protein KBAD10_21750 [Aeromonas dhakensis]CAD7527263.1 hypothetical protein KBAD05_21720 [Aeromonas dhakensis]